MNSKNQKMVVLSRIKYLSLFIALFLSFNCHSQIETKFITKKRTGYSEQYEVIKKGKKVKHGSYIKFKVMEYSINLEEGASFISNSDDRIIILEQGKFLHGKKEGRWQYFFNNKPWNTLKKEGQYIDGKKHGLWTEYWPDSLNNETSVSQFGQGKKPDSLLISINNAKHKFKSRGVYYQGIKNGAWQYYNFEGKLSQKYDHSSKLLLYTIFEFEVDELAKNHKLNFIGGNAHFNNFMFDNASWIKFDEEPKSESLQFEVEVNSQGNIVEITQISADKNISNFNEKIIEALKLSDGLWIPKKINSKYCSSTFNLNVTLKMNRRGESIFYSKMMKFEIERE